MRMLTLLALLMAAPAFVLAAEEGAQAVGGMRYATPSYQLVLWSAGHFAVKVGGSWMPGCVALNVGNIAQYQTDQLSYMEGEAEPIPGGRKITISGRLTPEVSFTQTLTCVADSITVEYMAQALKDLPDSNIRLTASPQLDQMKGKTLEIETPQGRQQVVWPAAQAISATDVSSLVWRDVGLRDARTVFVSGAGSQVNLGEKTAAYVAWLHKGPMKQGQSARATVRFEAIPVGDAATTVANVHGRLGNTRFNVSGKSGLLNNVRTDRGLLIQQLSINEQDLHQVQIGQGKGSEWGGVRLSRQEPGQEYVVEGRGGIINDWQEKIEARKLSASKDEIRWSAHRTLDKGEQRLRVLMYVAQWLEQEQTAYHIRTPDGKIQSHDDEYWMWFGKPAEAEETGLGPYRVIGKYPAGTEIVVPMPARGEQMTVRLGQPMELSGFRFEIYFRGLWLQALDNKQQDLDLTVTVEKLPVRQVGPLQVTEDPIGGGTTLTSGGMPLLSTGGRWTWRALADEAEGVLRVGSAQAEGWGWIRVGEHLLGRVVTVRPLGGKPYTSHKGRPIRLGAEMSLDPLPAGTTLEFAPTALERVSLRVNDPAAVRLGKGLSIGSINQPLELALKYWRVLSPTADAIAARPAHSRALDDPSVYGGLNVKRDTPAKGDVTVVTPWWEVVHTAARGGAISSIRFFNGTNQNILVNPIDTALWAPEEFRDVDDPAAKLTVLEATPTLVRLQVTGQLKNRVGKALCPFEHVYDYHPMLVRRTCRYELGNNKVQCSRLEVGSLNLRSWLDEAATREADERTTWHHAVFPGPEAFRTNDFSQYLCLFKRGVEGIDWVPAADLSQWRGFGGRAKSAWYGLCGDEQGNGWIVVEPLGEGSQPITLTGTLQFDSYLSLPQTRRCLQRRNFVACLDNGECTQDMLKQCADYGVTDIMLGAGNNPGSFELTDLKASQKTVRAAAQYRIKTYPFDPFQLVNRRTPLWQQHELMGRMELRNGKPQLAEYSSYGDYFCPSSKEFRDALKTGYTKLVESANFGGLYHDFTHPYTCYNEKHWPSGTAGPTREEDRVPGTDRVAAAVPDAQGHINTDGVLDMILWDRAFLGQDRVFQGHTGWVPVLFFQDLCTVTAIFEEYPSTEPLPLHLTPAQGEFVNAAQRTLVSSFLANGTGAPGEENPCPPTEVVDAYLSRCALVGIFPWMGSGNVGAADSYDLLEKSRPWYRLFALRGKNDLGTMQFLPWHRQTAVLSNNSFVRAATYWNADKAIIVLANSESAQPANFAIIVLPEQFGWAKGSKLTQRPMKDCDALSPTGPNAFAGKLPGFGWAAYELTRSER
ncbi:MAG: hypothetical protein ACYC63_00240 [Armatimonadota bacterium]